MDDTAASSKLAIFQLHKEQPEVGYKLLYSILAEFQQA